MSGDWGRAMGMLCREVVGYLVGRRKGVNQACTLLNMFRKRV